LKIFYKVELQAFEVLTFIFPYGVGTIAYTVSRYSNAFKR